MNEPLDMSRFIEAKSDQLNADDLIGNSRVLTVTRVVGCEGDQPIAIHYEGDHGKPFKPCKTIRRVLMAVWGKYANEYVGKSMRVYRDDKVMFGGLEVGGIRISHMSHLEKETVVVVMKSKGKKAGMKILPLGDAPVQVDKAAQWAEGFIAAIGKQTDPTALGALIDKQAKTLDRLKGERPDLHSSVELAITNRKAELNDGVVEDDDPFGLPAIDEGKSDEDKGEAFTMSADELIGFINAKVTAMDVNSLVSSHKDTIASFDEDDRARVASAQAEKIAAIKGGAK